MSPTLIKLPFILLNSIVAQLAVTPPNPPPNFDESSKYQAEKRTKDFLDTIFWWHIPLVWVAIHLFNVIEAYTTLSHIFPSLRNSTLDHYLLPNSAPDIAERLRLTPVFIAGSISIISSALLRLLCFRTLGKYFTFNLAIVKDHKLITNGPYAIVRHPAYLGMIIYAVGLYLTQFGKGSWWRESGISNTKMGYMLSACMGMIACGFGLLLGRIPKEDFVLRNEFGNEWDEWAKRVPYKLIPGIY
ncbi:hypothetical protein K474DRAFT_1663011 [Panus rudis PR-1116 ss-1]|nr:hypothetical protein K474DRAFT_1663011 [Panus rudis PR-1116 ss-1]